jgi:hypothetical protein
MYVDDGVAKRTKLAIGTLLRVNKEQRFEDKRSKCASALAL